MNNRIDTVSPSFYGKLKLHHPRCWNKYLAERVSNNEVLNALAEKQNSDIFVFQSMRIAPSTKKLHYAGEPLYKIFIAKEDPSFLGKIKQFFGLNKVGLSKGYHSRYTVEQEILPNLSLNQLNKKIK